MFTALGMGIRFKGDDVRPMGLVAGGVNAIKLSEGDLVIGVETYNEKSDVLLISEKGQGWRIAMKDFPLQGRYGQGVISCRMDKGSVLAVCFAGTSGTTSVIHYRNAAAKTVKVGDIPVGKRAYAGKNLMEVKKDDEVIGQTRLMDCFSLEFPTNRSKKKG